MVSRHAARRRIGHVVKPLDWAVFVATVAFILGYGASRARGAEDVDAYFRGGRKLRWPTIGLSVMATQASAITFLSTPGQAYEDGLRFVQLYFGLPLAMVLICAVFVPIYRRLNLYTAYEYLEHRFDVRVRYLGALLFLIQRGLAAGITIYAPAIVLSSILGWSLEATTLGVGSLIVVYTVAGGVGVVGRSQKQQMIVMLLGMLFALGTVLRRVAPDASPLDAVRLAGALGRMNSVSFELDLSDRYNFWSGITGGLFLALAYFGTDQSQVQRYLAAPSVAESRLGLLLNGILKVPMQCLILFIGVMVYVFYLFTQPPISFNPSLLDRARQTSHAGELSALEQRHERLFHAQRDAARVYLAMRDSGQDATHAKESLRSAAAESAELRGTAKELLKRAVPDAESNDTDYVLLTFVLRYVPSGFVGLLIAAILCAAMSSTASELTALGSTSTLDCYLRVRGEPPSARHGLLVSKLFTAFWGLVAVSFASLAALLDNLVEAVNILGSLFYGTMLGLFLVGFFIRPIGATAVLLGAVVAEGCVLALFFTSNLGFLWFNVVGSVLVIVFAALFQLAQRYVVFLRGEPK